MAMTSITLMGMMIFIVLVAIQTSTTLAESQSISLPDCPDRCGEVKVPYPFGISEECSLLEKFYLNCTQSSLFLHNSGLQVTNVSLDGDLSIMHFIGRDCYDEDGQQERSNSPRLWLKNFNISSARNRFTAVGCDTYATISGYRGETEYITGCMSSCNFIDSTTSATESCSGVGCCQTPIPGGLKNMTISLSSYNNHTFVYDFNPCSYAFVVEDGKFNFSEDSFRDLNDTEKLPVVLNWAIGEESCDEAEKSGNLACKGNTTKCVEASNGPGYLCQCLPGYEGNPYLPDGCHDIDECKISNPCDKSSTCQNLPGNYSCICPNGDIASETGCSNACGSNQSARALVKTGHYISVIVIIFYFLSSVNGIY